MPETLETLRHALATLAYRSSKAVRGASPAFAAFRVNDTTRTPAQILAHMGDLMDWGLSMSRGEGKWNTASPLPWEQEIERFFAALTAWDRYLASGAKIEYPWERLFQGPIADALTHTGQLTMLRRMAGEPMKGESYNRAAIAIGQTGFEQPAPDPRVEFD